jgi:hypothetical protein
VKGEKTNAEGGCANCAVRAGTAGSGGVFKTSAAPRNIKAALKTGVKGRLGFRRHPVIKLLRYAAPPTAHS